MFDTPTKQVRRHPNRLGVFGWLGGGRWGPDRYLYSLHRVTGLGLLAYFLVHVFVTASRAVGQQAWETSMAKVSGPLFYFGEYLVFVAFAFHAINGLRLVFAELGLGVGKLWNLGGGPADSRQCVGVACCEDRFAEALGQAA